MCLPERERERTGLGRADENVERKGGKDNLVQVGNQRRGGQIADRIAEVKKTSEEMDIPIGESDITL